MEETVVEKDSEKTITEITTFINKSLNGNAETPKYGFVLMTFDFGEVSTSLTYVSNTKREGMIQLLKYQAEILENNADVETGFIDLSNKGEE